MLHLLSENVNGSLKNVLSDDQCENLARTLIGVLLRFYDDPENERKFQDWKGRGEAE